MTTKESQRNRKMTEDEKKIIADEMVKSLCSLLGATSSRVYCVDHTGKSTRNIIIKLPNE